MNVLAHHMSRVGDLGSHMSWYMPLIWLVVVGAIVVGVVLVTRTLVNRPTTGSSGGTGVESRPLQILEERFARGEIDVDEFRARRDALKG